MEPEKRGRQPLPSALLVDSQTVKTNYEGESRGFHGGKRIKGRSRQIATDTMGNIWEVHVHAANQSDTKEGAVLTDLTLGNLPAVKILYADKGYRGTFLENATSGWNVDVHISQRDAKGFSWKQRDGWSSGLSAGSMAAAGSAKIAKNQPRVPER